MEVVSAWIALTPAGVGNGSVVLLSGTHLQTFPYVVNSDPNTRFDHVIPTEHLPMERASCPTLLPGQAIFFSQSIVHGAARNESDEPRVSVSIRYVPEIDDGTGVRRRAPACNRGAGRSRAAGRDRLGRTRRRPARRRRLPPKPQVLTAVPSAVPGFPTSGTYTQRPPGRNPHRIRTDEDGSTA